MIKLLPLPKAISRHFLAFCLLILMLAPSVADACVDYHPVPPRTTIKIDSTYTFIELVVHNLQLFNGGSNGAFCTCSFSHYTDLFSNVYFVDFVTSGDDMSLSAFDPWTGSVDADTAWSGVMPGNTWDSFIALMIDSAVNAGDTINLVLRATLPPGFDSAAVAASLDSLRFGTDEWDPTRVGNLAFSHNSVSLLEIKRIDIVATSDFVGIPEIPLPDLRVDLYPNPFAESTGFYLKTKYAIPPDLILSVFDLNGALVREERITDYKHYFNRKTLSGGLYLYRMSCDSRIVASGRLVLR